MIIYVGCLLILFALQVDEKSDGEGQCRVSVGLRAPSTAFKDFIHRRFRRFMVRVMEKRLKDQNCLPDLYLRSASNVFASFFKNTHAQREK